MMAMKVDRIRLRGGYLYRSESYALGFQCVFDILMRCDYTKFATFPQLPKKKEKKLRMK